MQQVHVSLLPFHLHRKTIEVPEGLTLQNYVDHIYPKKIRGVDIVVNIGDEIVPKHMWSRIKPKPMTLIGINAIPAGGKGKKNPLATILSIALIVAAPYIASALAPSLAISMAGAAIGPVSPGAIAFASGLIKVGIGVVGYLASSMLSSTPKQRGTDPASASESSTNFIEGASNKIDPFGVIPCNLGTNRMFPNQAALPYTEVSGNKQYVRQLFTYGFGKVVISERRIGETLLTEYDGVEVNDRLDADMNAGMALYSNDVYQEGFSVTISNAAGYILRTTQRNIDEAELDITFANGLTIYNDAGQRVATAVDIEIQFSPTGLNTWSSAASPTSYGSQSVVLPNPTTFNNILQKFINYHLLILDVYTGAVSYLTYTQESYPPPIPANKIRIGSLRTERGKVGVASVFNLVDERSAYIANGRIYTSGSFLPSYPGTGLTINIAAGQIGALYWHIVDATAQALRVTQRLVFPTNGQYDIRVRRLTADSATDRQRDEATLTAIRSIKHSSPVLQANISGTAMRMQGTDQLNGSVSQYNVICSTLIKDYDFETDTWIDNVPSSNPASIYRYVLQSPAFVKALPDDRIDLEALADWHSWCREEGLTYNRVVDFATSVDDLLADIAAAGMATPHKINGVYSVLVDNSRPTISGLVTPRNSWGYKGQITYPELPHALRVQFRNKNKGYQTDERIVYADGYNEATATLFERLDFPSCTDSTLAWYYGRIYLATAILQPEVHTFNMDFENLTFNRGDKILLINDAILVGVGQGRIKQTILNGAGTHLTGFVLDDYVTIPDSATNYAVRIRYSNKFSSGFYYYDLRTVFGETNTFTFKTPIFLGGGDGSDFLDSLCAFTKIGTEIELIVTEISMNKDHSAKIIGVNYAPARFDAVSGAIPAFNSNVTIPLDQYRPLPPQLGGVIQSDETVMLRNSDGSYTGRMVIPLTNVNEPSVGVIVRYRAVGATQWSNPNVLSASAEQVVLTGLEDGSNYDISISYQRANGQQLVSQPLLLNGTAYVGASNRPADVTGFTVNTDSTLGLFEWNNNPDIDIDHYVIKFTRLTTGAEWVNSQVVADDITTNRFNFPIQAGTYLIKAFDILGNESLNATTIVSIDNGAFNNVVELLQGQTAWSGTKVNCHAYLGSLYLTDTETQGEYYFDEFDLGDVYESTLSSSLEFEGAYYNEVRDIVSVRGVASMRGAGSNEIRVISSIRALQSIRGIDPADFSVVMEISKSLDGITYTDWETFTVGKHIFRYLKIRLLLNSTNGSISPRVITAEVLVDMPDRYESGDNVSCPPSGVIVAYNVGFRNNPAVNITLQNGAVDDKLEFISKTETGFEVKVYNQTTAGYVTRTFDWHAAGYGRIVV